MYIDLDELTCLENLEERGYFPYLINDLETYYTIENGFHGNIDKLKELFKAIRHNSEGFPNDFVRQNIHVEAYGDKLSFINAYRQACYLNDIDDFNELVVTPLFEEIESSIDMKNRVDLRNKSKVTLRNSITNTKFDDLNYEKSKNLKTLKNTLVSITDNHIDFITDINNDDTLIELINGVIEQGGYLIESYYNNYTNLVSCGFMPISACKFDYNHISDDWFLINEIDPTKDNSWKELKNEDLKFKKSPIIFYIYTGTRCDLTLKKWINNIKYDTYDEAKNKQIKAFKEIEKYVNERCIYN